jgi:hypothetical protein
MLAKRDNWVRQTELSRVPADGKQARLTAPHQSPNSCWGQPSTLCQHQCG